MPELPLQHSLIQAIEQAIAEPLIANFKGLLAECEHALLGLPDSDQLRVAGQILPQLIELYVLRAQHLLDAWEAKHSPTFDEPILTTEMLQAVLRQTMNLDLDEVMVGADSSRNSPQPTPSVVSPIAQTNLLEFLDPLHQDQAHERALQVAHAEDISAWIKVIRAWLQEHPKQQSSLLEMQRSLGMPLIQLWLAVLLGEFSLEQREDFYQLDSLWVSLQPNQVPETNRIGLQLPLMLPKR